PMKKEKNNSPPSGTRDFLPRELHRRRQAAGILAGRFERHGFLPVETPALERIQTLTGVYGDEGDKLIFKILPRGQQAELNPQPDLALRYDLTVPAVRALAEHDLLQKGFRRYQIGPVWRAERAARGRFREFWQCDVDLYNTPTPLAEAETVAALEGGLRDLGMRELVISVNTRGILRKLCDLFKISEAQRKAVLIALDKLDKFPIPSVRREIAAIPCSGARLLADALHPEFAAELLDKDTLDGPERDELAEITEAVAAAASRDLEISVNPLLARGLDYYTGFIFEFHTLGGSTRAIAAGGRYDNLAAEVAGSDCRICGGSIGLERVLDELEVQDSISALDPPADDVVHLTLFSPEMLVATEQLARELRDLGLKVYVSRGGKIGDQFKAAERAGHRRCLIYGPDEEEKAVVTLKDLETGAQSEVSISDLAGLVEILKGI
ncbi:MAG: histidine--tRNA ligase, partial [Alphaproteobacteria bacterium]|nr:histidine--tRNA ligase [Alphaproteobacteria bacterium]